MSPGGVLVSQCFGESVSPPPSLLTPSALTTLSGLLDVERVTHYRWHVALALLANLAVTKLMLIR